MSPKSQDQDKNPRPGDPDGTSSPKPKTRKTSFRKMALLIKLWPVYAIILAVLLVCLLFLPLFGKPLISFQRNWEISSSDLSLEEIKDLYRINSSEYIYKVIFPYDFFDPGISELGILKKVQANLGKDPKKFLNPEEQEYLQTWNLAKKYRLNIKAPDYHFLVATVIIRAGFSFEDINKITLNPENPEGTPLSLEIPPAKILDIRVEDPIRNEYPFPDVPLSPEGWKEIAALMKARAQRLSLQDGILEEAEENARDFLSSLLKSSGFSSVEFKNIASEDFTQK